MTTQLDDAEPGGGGRALGRFARAVVRRARRLLADNWMVLVYAILIALCVIYAPSKTVRFIYAEF